MLLNLYSWNGNLINDKTNYNAWFDIGQRGNLSAEAILLRRPYAFPYLSGKTLNTNPFVFHISVAPGVDFHTARETLKGWFAINDFDSHKLLAKDTADSNRVWYLSGYITKFVEEQIGVYAITLTPDDPMWRVSTVTTDTWNITASNQTHDISVLGNVPTPPVLDITAASSRSNGGYDYKRWVCIYNVIAAALNNHPLDITDGGWDTASLVKNTSKTQLLNGAINASVTTINIDTPGGGGLPTTGGMCYIGTEQIYYTGIVGNVMTVYDDGSGTTGRGWAGTTAASHADNATVYWSQLCADGSDINVLVDGARANYWIGGGGANSATTKLWIAPSWTGKISGTISAAMTAGAITTISVAATTANKTALTNAMKIKNKILLIGSEAFKFTGVTTVGTTYKFTGVTRAQKGTTAASHAVGAAWVIIEHDIWVQYGNPLPKTTNVNDDFKPIINLATSSNTSWVYANFVDSTSVRPAEWTYNIKQTYGRLSEGYTGNQEGDADPSTELGCSIAAYYDQAVWKAPTARVSWTLYSPVGFTTVVYRGKKYAYVRTSFPTVCGLQTTTNGTTWTTVQNETVPATAATWTAFGPYTKALGATYYTIAFALDGSIGATANHKVSAQFDTITLTLDSTRVPSITFGAEQNQYYIDCTITNVTTGDVLYVSYAMKVNETITIDCAKKTVTYSDGDANILGAVDTDVPRQAWFNLQPGTNTLKFTDTGTGNITFVTTVTARAL